jgi:hypothetical protein
MCKRERKEHLKEGGSKWLRKDKRSKKKKKKRKLLRRLVTFAPQVLETPIPLSPRSLISLLQHIEE